MELIVRPEDAAERAITPDMSYDIRRLCACGRMFMPYRSFQRYCCDAHRIKYSKGRPSTYVKRPIETKECKECGKAYKTSDGKRHYCSKECYDAYQLKRRTVPELRHCLVCGAEFESAHWLKRYCSAVCRTKARE